MLHGARAVQRLCKTPAGINHANTRTAAKLLSVVPGSWGAQPGERPFGMLPPGSSSRLAKLCPAQFGSTRLGSARFSPARLPGMRARRSCSAQAPPGGAAAPVRPRGDNGTQVGRGGEPLGRQKAPDPLRTSCWGTEGGVPPGEPSSGAATDGDGAGNITPAAERHQKRPRIFSVPGEDALRLFPVPRVFKWFRFLALYCLVNFAALSSCCSDFCLIRVTS